MKLLGYEIKKIEGKTPTQLIAEAFIGNALNVINSQIGKEVTRCGFSIDKLKKGEIKLERRQQNQDTPAGEVIVENYKIGEVVILAVRWSQNGFTIERNSDLVIQNLKRVRAGFKASILRPDTPVIDLNARMSERDILIEKRTQEILKESNDKMLQNGKEN